MSRLGALYCSPFTVMLAFAAARRAEIGAGGAGRCERRTSRSAQGIPPVVAVAELLRGLTQPPLSKPLIMVWISSNALRAPPA
jgi:hypothetical protein